MKNMTTTKRPVDVVELEKKLQKDGVDPACTDEEKVAYLWDQYVRTEASLQAAVTSIKELRRQQAEEMREVENYVEHIRRLSNDHEALTLEFEAENEQLKEEVDRLNSQLVGYRDEETVAMLVQQGLDDIAEGSIGEQIAYLLVERARLMDELEAEQARNVVHTAEGPMTAEQLMMVLEEERQEFEVELSRLQGAVEADQQHIKVYEEERSSFVDKNDKLQNLLNDSDVKNTSLEREISELKELLDAQTEKNNSRDNETTLQQKDDLDNLQQQLKETNMDLFTKLQDLEQKKEELECVNEQLVRKQCELETARTGAEKEQKKLENLISDYDKMKLELAHLQKEHAEGEEELKVLERDFREKEETYEQLEKSVHQKQDQLRQTEEQLELKTGWLQKEKAGSTENQQEETGYQQELSELKAQYEEEIQRCKDRVKEVEEENEAIRQNIASLTADLSRDKASHDENLEERELHCKQLQEELESQQKTLCQLETTNRELEMEKDDLAAKVQLLESHIEENKQQNSELPQNLVESELLDKSKLDMISDELDTALKSLDIERQKSQDLEAKVTVVERLLEEAKALSEDQTSEYQTNIKLLESKISSQGSETKTDTLQKQAAHNEYRNEIEDSLKRQVADWRDQAEHMVGEKANLQNKLKQQKEMSASLETEVAVMSEKLVVLDKANTELELESRQMAGKLLEWEEDVRNKESQLQREKNKNKELTEQNNSQQAECNHSVSDLRSEVRKASAEMLQKEDENYKLKSQIEFDKKQSQRAVSHLEEELDHLKRINNTETTSTKERLDSCRQEIADLRNKLVEKEEELLSIRHKNDRASYSSGKTETLLNNERRLRTDLEKRLRSLEEDNNKAWQRVQELTSQGSMLQLHNGNMEMQVEHAMVSTSQNLLYNQKMAVTNDQTLAYKHAETVDRKLYELQQDLDDTMAKLHTAEGKLGDSERLKQELQEKRDEILQLKNQLHDERLQRSLLGENNDEVNEQISKVRERERELQRKNNELQHMLLDVESKLDAMKDQTETVKHIRLKTQRQQQQLQEQVEQQHREMELLQVEIIRRNDIYEQQCQKYTDRKLRTKNKFQRAREMFIAEKSKLHSQKDALAVEVIRLQEELSREHEWREKMEVTHRKVTFEKRDLLAQLTEFEEQNRDDSRNVSVLQVRARFLEEENNSLQQRVDSLTRQKHNLDRLVKEYQLERHRQDLAKNLAPELSLVLGHSHTTSSSLKAIDMELMEIQSST